MDQTVWVLGQLGGYLCCGIPGRLYLPACPSHSTLFWALGAIGGLPVPRGSGAAVPASLPLPLHSLLGSGGNWRATCAAGFGGSGTCQPAPPTPPLSRANHWTLVPIHWNAAAEEATPGALGSARWPVGAWACGGGQCNPQGTHDHSLCE